MIGLLEDAQVRQGGEVAYAQLCGDARLVINANEQHEILHAAHYAIGLLFAAEEFAE